jgi:signal peptidase I
MAASEGFAFLLALLLKWKLVGAFIVPTGAMAPTVEGNHADVVCANCGMKYAVSMSMQALTPWQRESLHAACSNCGQQSEIAAREPILRGDRILVEKISRPRRWDLMVFQCPEDRRINYIKRVAGMPGETVEIADGDLFVNGRRLTKRPSEALDMWLLVHDSSRVPKRVLTGGPHWQPKAPSSRWKFDGGQWKLNGTTATGDALVFSGRLTDVIAYNEQRLGDEFGKTSRPLVGDIKLVCDLKQFSGDGSLELRWEFRNEKVRTTISADGQVQMAVSVATNVSEAGTARETVVRGKLKDRLSVAHQLALAVRDGYAYLTDNDQVVVSLVVGSLELADIKDRKEAVEPCRLEILGSRSNVILSKIVLWKDIYYCDLSQIPGVGREAGWGCAGHPIHLGRGEYFVLGDNSSRSKDSRFWGVVPADAVVGIARWTYWPFDRRHRFH